MKERPKDLRHARVERSPHHGIHDDSSHLWAVSYSDFLMVLLCFFILFFSVNDGKKEDIIQKIFMDTKSGGQGSGGGGANSAGDQNQKGKRFPAIALQDSLHQFSFSVVENEAGLLIHFPDDLYSAGSYEIRSSQAEALAVFLKKVLPYKDIISLTFVGHADNSQVQISPKKKYSDNFDLSSLRATRALQFAVKAGFPEEQMAAKGTSKNARASRTISILIKPKSEML